MENLIKVTGEERERLAAILYSLTRKANAFHTMGNTNMADYLYDVAHALEVSSKRVQDVVGETIRNEINRSHESLTLVLKASLAGAAMVTKKKGTRKALKKLGDAVD